MFNWIKDNYNNILVYVIENGYLDDMGILNDFLRVELFFGYISEVLKGIFFLIYFSLLYVDIYSLLILE